MLSSPLASAAAHHAAAHYAAALAQFLAVRLLQVPLDDGAYSNSSSRLVRQAGQPGHGGPATARWGGAPLPAAIAHCPVPEQPLLLVLARPLAGQIAALTQYLLQASTLPLLVVPAPATGCLPPRRFALAADGEPFVLDQGLRTMHALLMTLPTQLTVLHTQLPHSIYAQGDALHAVQSCGLACRHLAIEGRDLPALEPAAGIMAGMAQASTDLLVVPVRPRHRWNPAFAGSITVRLLMQSPVPVLLLPVSAPPASQRAA